MQQSGTTSIEFSICFHMQHFNFAILQLTFMFGIYVHMGFTGVQPFNLFKNKFCFWIFWLIFFVAIFQYMESGIQSSKSWS